MNLSKEQIEEILTEQVRESFNYNDSILSVDYNMQKEEFTVVFKVHIVEEDNYIGLMCY